MFTLKVYDEHWASEPKATGLSLRGSYYIIYGEIKWPSNFQICKWPVTWEKWVSLLYDTPEHSSDNWPQYVGLECK